jgi:uncharacterized repeat protein (TIGR01451 family)
MKKLVALFILISLKSFSQNTCAGAIAFCDSILLPSLVNGGSAQVGPDYDCLFTQPNCTWFYTQITAPGNLSIVMSASSDIDFVCWGPFSTLNSACNNLTAANVVDCSYSSSSSETLTISNANTGQYYIFLTTNFSNLVNPIFIKKYAGTGNTCSYFSGVNGFVYKDLNANCIKNPSDLAIQNAAVKIYDNIGNLLGQTNTNQNGEYWLAEPVGTYSVVIDTVSKPYVPQCTYPGIDSIVNLTPTNTVAANVNFNVNCKPGFDIGVQSVNHIGLAFPGITHTLDVFAGNINSWYNLNCSPNISGVLTINVIGPVTFTGVPPGALAPSSISGNIFTYNIANLSTINLSSFLLAFGVNTTAIAGNLICVNASITPTIGDNNPSNNTVQMCYTVTNSYDPNKKETYPVNVQPGYADWINYTIYFQNTGNAPAMNIRLLDTLSNLVNLNTFQLVNSSHPVVANLMGSKLEFKFNNINLPDSISNPVGSIGFAQYRIKPKPNLVAGTKILNRAHIYFDYNAPIATNTSTNNFLATVGLSQQTVLENYSIYPNPTTGKFTISVSDFSNTQLEVYDLVGKLIIKTVMDKSAITLDLSKENSGMYLVKLNSDKGTKLTKLVKQ